MHDDYSADTTTGKTVTTEKLEKENRPPLTIFGTSIIYLHDAPAPNTEDLKAPSAQPQPPSESKIPPGMTKERQKEAAGLNEQAIKKRIAEQKPAMTPAETVEFLKKRMETGVAIQWQGMRSTYALLTENFPARMTRCAYCNTSRVPCSGVVILAAIHSSQTHRTDFTRNLSVRLLNSHLLLLLAFPYTVGARS
jgi:hypothetical protein